MKPQNQNMKNLTNHLRKMVEEKGIKTEEEFNQFFEENVFNKSIDELGFDEDYMPSDEEYAVTLVYEAEEESDIEKALDLIDEALFTDKYCIEAYLFLVPLSENNIIRKIILEQAIKSGKKKFPKSFINENKGHLYGLIEVRPYLMAIFHLAQIYMGEGYSYQAISKFKKLIKMNPNDNVGARDFLMLLLLEVQEFKKYKKYQKQYKDDISAFSKYNEVYYSFLKDNDLEKTKYLLEAAKKQNKHVIKKLLNDSKIKLSDTAIILGDVTEANYYCFFARDLWQENKILIHWLKQNQ